jgi:hypothetical protein
MKDILLQGTLGHSQIDSVVQEVIQVYDDTFPGQIAAYYKKLSIQWLWWLAPGHKREACAR